MKFQKRISLAVFAAALSGSVYAAPAALAWSVDESAVLSASQISGLNSLNSSYDGTFDVNRMTFSYGSTISQGAFSGSPSTANFTETGTFKATQYFSGFVPGGAPGVSVTSGMGFGLYDLIGTFTFDGTATITSLTTLDVDISSGTLNVYIDKERDGVVTIADLIGSATSVQTGGAILSRPNVNQAANGSFEVIYDDFLLSDFGKTYWTDPDPFHMFLDISAQVIGLEGVFNTEGANVTVNGDGSAYFRVPEPASLALLGLGLLGLGFSSRRKNA